MVSIIIINYRQKNLLTQCVQSIFDKLASYPFEVIIINNSPEDDLSQIAGEFQVRIIENENKGYPQANNIGAGRSRGEYLLFLNADTIVKNDFLKNSVELFKDKEIGAIGLKLLNEDRSFQLSFWKENNFINEFLNKNDEKAFQRKNKKIIQKFGKRYTNVSEVDWVTGAAMLVPRDTFKKIGGFDEDYFLFYEDADFCKRLKSAGYKIIFYPFSEIIHLKGENVNERFSDETYFFAKQSQLTYYRKHNNLFNRILLRFYLVTKFSLLSILTFKKINFEILLLALGLRNSR
jgi:hypothetical protein